jgi:hypothetical protein
MKIDKAQVEVWNGRSFLLLDFHQAPTDESLGAVIREYVAAMGLRLVYWCKSP